MKIDAKLYPILSPEVRVRKESFGQLLISRRHRPICINEDGVRIVQLMDGKHTYGQIVQQLASEPRIEQQSTEDLEDRLSAFMEFGLAVGAFELKTAQL